MSTPKVQRPSVTPLFSSSKARRGSLSSPCLPTVGTAHHLAGSTYGSSSVEAINSADKRTTSGSRGSSALALFNRAVGLSQLRLGGGTSSEKGKSRSQLDTSSTTTMTGPSGFGSTLEGTSSEAEARRGRGAASYLANEILILIFRHLMDRKSILNCSLVSSHWHAPARSELERIVQDMPFNGQGLVHAIRYERCLSILFFLFFLLLFVCQVVQTFVHKKKPNSDLLLQFIFFSFFCMKKKS